MLRERDLSGSSRDSGYWSHLRGSNSPSSSDLTPPGGLTSLVDPLAMSNPSQGLNDLETFPTAQSNFLNNLKKLNQLKECSSNILNSSTDFDLTYNPVDVSTLDQLLVSSELSTVPHMNALQPPLPMSGSLTLSPAERSRNTSYNAMGENLYGQRSNKSGLEGISLNSNFLNGLCFNDNSKNLPMLSPHSPTPKGIHLVQQQNIPISNTPMNGTNFNFNAQDSLDKLRLDDLDNLLGNSHLLKLQRHQSLPPRQPMYNQLSPKQQQQRNITRHRSDFNNELHGTAASISPSDHRPYLGQLPPPGPPPSSFSPRAELPIEIFPAMGAEIYPPHSPLGYNMPPPTADHFGDMTRPMLPYSSSFVGFRQLR